MDLGREERHTTAESGAVSGTRLKVCTALTQPQVSAGDSVRVITHRVALCTFLSSPAAAAEAAATAAVLCLDCFVGVAKVKTPRPIVFAKCGATSGECGACAKLYFVYLFVMNDRTICTLCKKKVQIK